MLNLMSHQKRYDKLIGELEQQKLLLEDLQSDCQEQLDNMPKNMQRGKKANRLQKEIDALEARKNDLQNGLDNLAKF